MVGRTNARNSTNQNLASTKEARVILATTGLFTATVKTKVLSLSGVLDAVGADATYAVAIKRGANYRPVGEYVAADKESKLTGELVLDVGDILTNIGDSGSTNGTMDMVATVQEL